MKINLNVKNKNRKRVYAYPPGPREIFPYRLAFKFISNPLPVLKEITDKYGDISHFKFGNKLHVFLINDPYLIENILVKDNQYFVKSPGLQLAKRVIGNGLITNEGKSHSKQRSIVQQAFTKDKVKIYGNIISEHCIDYTNTIWKDGMIINIHKEMTKLSLSIISKLLFGKNTITLDDIDKISDYITTIIEYINKLRLPFLRFIERLPIPSTLEYRLALKELDNIIYSKINQQCQKLVDSENMESNDFKNFDNQITDQDVCQKHQSELDILSVLISSTYKKIVIDNKNEKSSPLDERKGQGIDVEEESITINRQLRDEIMTIFLAGHETTANSLTWTFYLLSGHPEIESKILDEISLIHKEKESGNNNNNRMLTVEDLPRLKFTEKVLMESMRLYPPSWAIGRQTIQDYSLNEKHIVPSGSVLIMSQYLMHHDSRYFSEPEEFIPERWSLKFKASMSRFSYFPFGGGPRSCIGEPLAWIEGILVLANIINNWSIALEEKNIANIKLQPLVTLRPKNGIRTKIMRRSTRVY